MLIISNSPFNLVKYHILNTNVEQKLLSFSTTNSLLHISNTLLNSVSYDSLGELNMTIYIVNYEGEEILKKEYRQNKNNKTYLIIKNTKVYKRFLELEGVTEFSLCPLQYQHEILCVSSILDIDAWPYFWSEYCIKKFNSNPTKWKNEVRYLFFLYQERGNKKFSIPDLDFLYNKTSDASKTYLLNMYATDSKKYLLHINTTDLFLLFIRGPHNNSQVFKSLETYAPQLLLYYMIFKDAFYKGKIRIQEAVFIFDYVVHNYSNLTVSTVRNLFNLN